MTDRNSASKTPVARSSWKNWFGRWFSSEEPSVELAPESEPPPPLPRPVTRKAPESIQPFIDGTMGPDSERTVYKRVPSHLLEKARDSHPISDLPPPPISSSYEEDDRTAVFAPPADLLRSVLEGESRHEVITARPPPDTQPQLLAESKPSVPPGAGSENLRSALPETGTAAGSFREPGGVLDEPPSSAPALTLEQPELTTSESFSEVPPSEPGEDDASSPESRLGEDSDDERVASSAPASVAASRGSFVTVLSVLAAVALLAYAYLQATQTP